MHEIVTNDSGWLEIERKTAISVWEAGESLGKKSKEGVMVRRGDQGSRTISPLNVRLSLFHLIKKFWNKLKKIIHNSVLGHIENRG